MGSHWHWYTEIWTKPLQFALPMLAMAAIFIFGGALSISVPDKGLAPRKLAT